jgi:hypothetical protein
MSDCFGLSWVVPVDQNKILWVPQIFKRGDAYIGNATKELG